MPFYVPITRLHQDVITAKSLVILHVVNLIVILAFPVAVTLCGEPSPGMFSVCCYTKLIAQYYHFMIVNQLYNAVRPQTNTLS